MRSFHSTLFALVIAGAAAGCSGSSAPTTEPVGESHARLILSMSGRSSASLRITAKDEDSASIAIDRSVNVTAGDAVVVSVDVPASSYAFHVAVFADASQSTLLGSADARADLGVDATTEIKLVAAVDGDGSAEVAASVNAAPEIEDVDVEVTGQGADGSIAVHVDASDAEDGELSFFWSGAGVTGTVQGGATIDLSTAAVLAAGSSKLHVIVQDAAGATAAVDIAIDVAAATASTSPCAPEACLDANAVCIAACDAGLAIDPLAVSAHVSCMATCAVSLASCSN